MNMVPLAISQISMPVELEYKTVIRILKKETKLRKLNEWIVCQ